MEVSYQFFEEENLLIQKYSGLFQIQKYFEFTGFITRHNIDKKISRVLIDFRDVIIEDIKDQSIDEYFGKLDKIVEFRKKINERELQNKRVSLVFWVDKPLPTVITHLFIENFSGMNIKYYSTSPKIIKFLDLPSGFKDLNAIANQLVNKF